MGRARRVALVFLLWTLVGLFFFSQDLSRKLYFHDPTPASQYLVSWLTGVWIAAAMTPVVLWLGRRFPVERRNWAPRLALHLLASLGYAVVILVLDTLILRRLGASTLLGKASLRDALSILAVLGLHGNIISYWTVWGIQLVLRYQRRYQERETALARAQLGALKGQLQPHFLFNTLNAIMVLVRQQKGPQAEETLGRLSDLLRCVLEDVNAQEVPLRRELEHVQLYLGIEQTRFADRLRVDIAADPAILDAAVPHLALQPLVENAIRHGIAQRAEAGRISISAVRVNGMIELKVTDDGPGLPAAGAPAGHGIGLANTRARLGQLYGDAARLAVENGAGGGAVVTMVLPYRVADEGPEVVALAVTALIVDDEPLARAGLRLLLEGDPELGDIREARNGREAVAAIREARPDLCFLDVQMPEMDGFAVVKTIGAEHMPATIFVTAHDRFAIQAFEINAIDYLLKPVVRERFARSLARAKARLAERAAGDSGKQILGLLETLATPRQLLRRLAVRSAGKTQFVDLEDVDWIEAAENYVQLHVGSGSRTSHLVHVTLSALEKSLDPAVFVRVHRSIIVRVARIVELAPAQHGEFVIVLAGGERLRSGRSYHERVKALTENPF